MQEILKVIDRLRGGKDQPGRLPLKELGFISCATTITVKHVPFYEPSITLIMSGRKNLYKDDESMSCEMGSLVTVPAPSSYNLKNEPDRRNQRYAALIIPFTADTLEHVRHTHHLLHDVKHDAIKLIKYEADDILFSAIHHYLTTLGDARLLKHRLMEILLILATKNPDILAYTLHRHSWSERVRAVIATDIARSWAIEEVSQRLATSESTLRRHLKKEDITFRELVYELRLTTALMQLLQTPHPINQIAYECGYKSVSNFSSNFHKRFGMSPKDIRLSVNESG